jgi:hypothetical protein
MSIVKQSSKLSDNEHILSHSEIEHAAEVRRLSQKRPKNRTKSGTREEWLVPSGLALRPAPCPLPPAPCVLRLDTCALHLASQNDFGNVFITGDMKLLVFA